MVTAAKLQARESRKKLQIRPIPESVVAALKEAAESNLADRERELRSQLRE